MQRSREIDILFAPIDMAAPWKNRLYYGDNLRILRESIADESVDLIYLDPPFNSNASYNVLFAEKSGRKSRAQITAFEDTWEWGEESELAYWDVVNRGGRLADLLQALRVFLGQNDMMAYLCMMAVRLDELHRVLKGTGSLYLHCDPTASHYLKIILDAIFGGQNFQSEIIWKRTSSHGNVSVGYGDVTDSIFFYSKGEKPTWNQQYIPYSDKHIKTKFTLQDPDGRVFTTSDLRNPGVRPNLHYEYKGYKPHPNGWAISREKMEQYDREGRLYFPPDPNGRIRLKRYLDEQPGQKLQTLWDDIPPINSQAQERLGYPTQKPQALLERIIKTSSNEGDVVIDPFCGCGTAISAAERLKRRWIGIDVTHLAVALIRSRLVEHYSTELCPYDVEGLPPDLESARALAAEDRFKFEWWVVGEVGALPRLKEDRKIIAAFDDSQVQRLLGFRPKGAAEYRMHLIVCLILDTGSRIDEVLSVERKDLDLDNMLLKIRHGKGSKERIVPVSLQMRKLLFRHVQRCRPDQGDLLFFSGVGQKLSQRNALRVLKRICERVGIDGLRCSFHTLRHTFGKNYIRNGGDVFRLQKILGHAKLEMTRRYVNLETSDLQRTHHEFSTLARQLR